jgi:hypothetical protein
MDEESRGTDLLLISEFIERAKETTKTLGKMEETSNEMKIIT